MYIRKFMKRILWLIIAIFCSVSVTARNKINFNGPNQLVDIEENLRSRSGECSPLIEAVVTMNQGWSDENFDKFDARIILNAMSDMLLIEIPADRIRDFSELPEVNYVEFGNEYHLMMDFGRPGSNVTQIQAGFDLNGLDVSYTGNGVVTGLMDNGIDPNHINFINEDGSLRVKRAYDFNLGKSAVTEREIKRFTTDDAKESHGTHVAGIMAGSYNREGDYVYMTSPIGGSPVSVNGNVPYYGVAIGSDIVMSGGVLTDGNIMKGVQNVIDYANTIGLPAVVNLSLGSNDGPHDSSTSLNRFLSEKGKEAIICLAAGNEGDSKMFVGKKFTQDDVELKTFILNNVSSGVDIWTNGPDPVEVSVLMVRRTNQRATAVATVSSAGQSVTAGDLFTANMSGTCRLRSEVNSLNNRYHVAMSGTFEPKTAGSSYNVAVSVKGKVGQEVFVYGYGDEYTSFTSNAVSGYTDGTTDGTISDLACSDNVVVVGSYNTRTSWPVFAGRYSYKSEFVVGEMSPFSSFGTSYSGIELPTISAPGAAIISSFNRYETNTKDASWINENTTAKVTASVGAVNYWGRMQGTSMACPYVSGTMALWLEADPTLDVKTITEILKTTAVKPDASLSDIQKKQWGGGRLDALAGIREVLRRKAEAGIDGVVADAGGYVITPAGDRGYNVVVDGADRLVARLYNMQGVAVAETVGRGGELTLDAAGMAPGVYILAVEASNAAPISRRVLLR